MRRQLVFACLFSVLSGLLVVSAAPAGAAEHSVALPMSTYRHIATDSFGHVYLTAGDSTGIVVRKADGGAVTTITNEPGADGMALSTDGSTLYVALRSADAISAISTTSLTETARYATGAATCPTNLAFLGTSVWFGYGCGGWAGNIGVIDMSVNPAVVSLSRAASSYYGAPLLAASPQLTSRIFAGEQGSSPAPIRGYDISGTTLTAGPSVQVDVAPSDLAITPDGSRLVVASGSPYYHAVYKTSDLSGDGQYGSNNPYPNAVAIAPNSAVAAGFNSPYGNDIIVFRADGVVLHSFDFGTSSTSLEPAGLAFSSDGRHLYAVRTTYASGLSLEVLNDVTAPSSVFTLSGPGTGTRGHSVTLSGTLASNPGAPIAGVSLAVTRTDLAGTHALAGVTTNGSGGFTFSNVPSIGGPNTYTVTYAGDTTHQATSKSFAVSVARTATAISVSSSGSTYNYNAVIAVTVHLGATYNSRKVYLYATPYHGTTALVKSAAVDRYGNLHASFRGHMRTTFTAKFLGDYRHAPTSAHLTRLVRAAVSERAVGYYATSHGYRVFHKSNGAVLASHVTPSNPGVCMRYRAQHYVSGHWVTGATGCFNLDDTSSVAAVLYGQIGPLYRQRAEFTGDTRNAPQVGAWVYVRFTN